MFEKVKVGLALGAGGARGLAHIGVLKALENAGVQVHAIAGTSIGALIGGCYASSGSAAQIEKMLFDFIKGTSFSNSGINFVRDAFREGAESLSERIEVWLKRTYLQAKFFSSPALLDSEIYRSVLGSLIPQTNIEDLPVPFRALGTDMNSGKCVVFTRGSLQEAVYGSAAIPGVVKPLYIDGLAIVDGGVLNMVPVFQTREMNMDIVIAVDVERMIERKNNYGNALDILFRIEDIQNNYLRTLQLKAADIVIRPEVGHIHWTDFEKAAELITLGYDAAVQQLDMIVKISKRKKTPWRFKRLIPLKPPSDWIEL